jgi:hypothetical protein
MEGESRPVPLRELWTSTGNRDLNGGTVNTHRSAAPLLSASFRSGALRSKSSRLLATAAVGLAVTLGASGCSMISPQATTIEYSASDGVNVPDSGPLDVRNALIVADESGATGNFIAAVVNDTDSTETLNIGIGGQVATVTVPARTTVSMGADGVEPLLINGLDSAPGSTVDVAFQSGDGEGVDIAVPVLDGGLPQYAPFVPTPAAEQQ